MIPPVSLAVSVAVSMAVSLAVGALLALGPVPACPPGIVEREATAIIASDLMAHPRADLETNEDAECIAAAVVEAFGVARLTELGLDIDAKSTPELTVPPMSNTEGDGVYAAFDDCIDFTARDIENFIAAGLSESEARCASNHYRDTDVPRIHLLLRNHDEVPHAELHARVEAAWEAAQVACRD